MNKLIMKKDAILNNTKYIKGDEIDVKEFPSLQSIIRLNEEGYIEPLSYRDLVLIERELNKKPTKDVGKEEV